MPFLLIAILLGQSAAAQAPPRDAASAHPPDGAIRGRITDKESGDPIPGALVMLRAGSESHTIQADSDGRYQFTALEAGTYLVAADGGFERATHLTQVFGDPRALEADRAALTKTFALKEGEVRNDVDISLQRAFAIEGRVVDSDGEPMSGVEVKASASDRSMWRTVQASTDDRGEFRLYGLPAAGYRVCAEPKSGAMAGNLLTDRTERLVKTCYSDAASEDEAQPVSTGAAATPRVEITVRTRAAYTVSGTVMDANATPVGDAGVSLLQMGPEARGISGVVDATGRFTISGVTSGRYLLIAHGPRRGGFPRKGEAIAGSLPVSVEGADVQGLTVSIARGAMVGGHVRFLDGPAPRTGISAMQVHVAADEYGSTPSFGYSMAYVNERLAFELADLFLPSRIAVAKPPSGWGVKAILYRGRDVRATAVLFENDPDPRAIEIQLTSKVADVTVSVLDASGAPAGIACVLAVDSTAPRPLRAGVFASARPDGTGQRFAALPAGTYTLAAVPLGDCERLTHNPALFDELGAGLQAVTLAAGEHRVMELRLAPLPPGR